MSVQCGELVVCWKSSRIQSAYLSLPEQCSRNAAVSPSCCCCCHTNVLHHVTVARGLCRCVSFLRALAEETPARLETERAMKRGRNGGGTANPTSIT